MVGDFYERFYGEVGACANGPFLLIPLKGPGDVRLYHIEHLLLAFRPGFPSDIAVRSAVCSEVY